VVEVSTKTMPDVNVRPACLCGVDMKCLAVIA
jgi:hypothetical protein